MIEFIGTVKIYKDEFLKLPQNIRDEMIIDHLNEIFDHLNNSPKPIIKESGDSPKAIELAHFMDNNPKDEVSASSKLRPVIACGEPAQDLKAKGLERFVNPPGVESAQDNIDVAIGLLQSAMSDTHGTQGRISVGALKGLQMALRSLEAVSKKDFKNSSP